MNTKTTKSISGLLPVAVLALSLLAGSPSGMAQVPVADSPEQATDHRPKKYSATRYIPTYSNSPFEREILPPTPPESGPPPQPFELNIVGVSRSGERYRVTLVDKKGKYLIVTDKPDKESGFHYTNIEPAAKIQDFRVEIAKDGQSMTEWAEFDTKRFSIVSKGVPPPKAPTNTRGRPTVVPNVPGAPPARPGATPTPPAVPQSSRGREASRRSGQEATDAIRRANAAAIQKAAASPRANTRRVVLPPPNR